MTKRVYVKTYGCQMNVYDSERIVEALAAGGYRPTETPEDASLVVLNTCHIREKAAEKVYSDLGRLRKLPRADASQPVHTVVAGCVAQAEGDEIVRRAPNVDIVIGPQAYHRLPELLDKVAGGERGIVATDFPAESKFDHLPEERATSGASAFLTIQEGCDKFCTFCVVPYTRGAEQSRPAADVVAEARRLVAGGAVELTLLGQNVNAYHGLAHDDAASSGATWGLGRLIRALAEIEGLARLRYTTSHPRDVDDELVEAHRDVPALMPFLHLPVQSGSDPVLAAMNRRHSADDYRRIVARLRNARPDLALSSDFIVGFPGETDADFAATMALVREIGFVQAYSFKYSPRPGTPAADREDAGEGAVPEAVKDARLAELQAELRQQQTAFNRAQVGRTLPVLMERAGRYDGQMVGRSPFMQPVHATAAAATAGTVVDVHITAAMPNSLAGELAGVPPASEPPASEPIPAADLATAVGA